MKAVERRKEIDEGAKLASSVDTMRKLVASEQTNLIKFRDESLKTIKEELGGLQARKQFLLSEVESLEELRIRLQEPLDAEWEKVKKELASIEATKQNLYATINGLKKSEKLYKKSFEELGIEKKRVEDLKTSARESFTLAERIKNEAAEILDEAHRESNEMDTEMNEREQQLHLKEDVVAIRERDMANGKEQNERDHKDIIKIKAQLASQRAILERAMKKLK